MSSLVGKPMATAPTMTTASAGSTSMKMLAPRAESQQTDLSSHHSLELEAPPTTYRSRTHAQQTTHAGPERLRTASGEDIVRLGKTKSMSASSSSSYLASRGGTGQDGGAKVATSAAEPAVAASAASAREEKKGGDEEERRGKKRPRKEKNTKQKQKDSNDDDVMEVAPAPSKDTVGKEVKELEEQLKQVKKEHREEIRKMKKAYKEKLEAMERNMLAAVTSSSAEPADQETALNRLKKELQKKEEEREDAHNLFYDLSVKYNALKMEVNDAKKLLVKAGEQDFSDVLPVHVFCEASDEEVIEALERDGRSTDRKQVELASDAVDELVRDAQLDPFQRVEGKIVGVNAELKKLVELRETWGSPMVDLLVAKKREVEVHCPSGHYPTPVLFEDERELQVGEAVDKLLQCFKETRKKLQQYETVGGESVAEDSRLLAVGGARQTWEAAAVAASEAAEGLAAAVQAKKIPRSTHIAFLRVPVPVPPTIAPASTCCLFSRRRPWRPPLPG